MLFIRVVGFGSHAITGAFASMPGYDSVNDPIGFGRPVAVSFPPKAPVSEIRCVSAPVPLTTVLAVTFGVPELAVRLMALSVTVERFAPAYRPLKKISTTGPAVE